MRIVSALCLMLISTGCHANDIMQGHWESSRPSAGRKANGHFGANMVLTASESQVRRDWVKYKANPRIPLVKNVSKGTPVSALVVFHGCTPDRAGYCQVEVQYALRTPTSDTKQLGRSVIWNGLPVRRTSPCGGQSKPERTKPGTNVVRALSAHLTISSILA